MARSGEWIVAVRGTGSIGQRHLQVLRAELGLAPIAVPVRPERGASPALAGFQVAPSLGSVAGPRDRRAAIIATDTGRHLADAAEAIEHGFQVLIEKPVAPTAAGVERLRALAIKEGSQVYVACNLRFARGLRRFRELLPEIGPVSSVRVECQSYLPEWRPSADYRRTYSARSEEGGVLRDLIHEVDYALWLFGRPSAVQAKLTNSGRLQIESEETADLLWMVNDSLVVTVRLDYLSRVTRRRMRAFGSEAELEWDAIRSTVTLERCGAAAVVEDVAQERNAMMADQARALLAVLEGAPNPGLCTLEEAEFALRVCDAARASSEAGREYTIAGGEP